MLLTKYENFDWINCNDIELQNARKEVNCLLKLSEEIQNKFKKNIKINKQKYLKRLLYFS